MNRARIPGESFEQYRANLKVEHRATKSHRRGRFVAGEFSALTYDQAAVRFKHFIEQERGRIILPP